MNSFYTGQKVVCINPYHYWQHHGGRRYIGPGKGEICLIRGIDSTGIGLLIVGHNTNPNYDSDGTEAGYHYRGFRPLVEYKTDISVFKALLVSENQTVDAHPLPVR